MDLAWLVILNAVLNNLAMLPHCFTNISSSEDYKMKHLVEILVRPHTCLVCVAAGGLGDQSDKNIGIYAHGHD